MKTEPYISSHICFDQDVRRNQEIHLKHMDAIKKGEQKLDNKVPIPAEMPHLKTNMKKLQLLQEQNERIEKENLMLMEKLTHMTTPFSGKKGKKKMKESATPMLKKGLHQYAKKIENERISRENKALALRIVKSKPVYSNKEWERQHAVAGQYLKSLKKKTTRPIMPLERALSPRKPNTKNRKAGGHRTKRLLQEQPKHTPNGKEVAEVGSTSPTKDKKTQRKKNKPAIKTYAVDKNLDPYGVDVKVLKSEAQKRVAANDTNSRLMQPKNFQEKAIASRSSEKVAASSKASPVKSKMTAPNTTATKAKLAKAGDKGDRSKNSEVHEKATQPQKGKSAPDRDTQPEKNATSMKKKEDSASKQKLQPASEIGDTGAQNEKNGTSTEYAPEESSSEKKKSKVEDEEADETYSEDESQIEEADPTDLDVRDRSTNECKEAKPEEDEEETYSEDEDQEPESSQAQATDIVRKSCTISKGEKPVRMGFYCRIIGDSSIEPAVAYAVGQIHTQDTDSVSLIIQFISNTLPSNLKKKITLEIWTPADEIQAALRSRSLILNVDGDKVSGSITRDA